MFKKPSYFIKNKPVLDIAKFEGFDFIVIYTEHNQKYSGKIMRIKENSIEFNTGDIVNVLFIEDGSFYFKRNKNVKIKYIILQNPYSGTTLKLWPEQFKWKDYIDETEYN